MSKKIKKRLKNTISAGLAYYKQTIASELQIHDKHMDGDDYREFMFMYIDVLSAEIEKAMLTLKLSEVEE